MEDSGGGGGDGCVFRVLSVAEREAHNHPTFSMNALLVVMADDFCFSNRTTNKEPGEVHLEGFVFGELTFDQPYFELSKQIGHIVNETLIVDE